MTALVEGFGCGNLRDHTVPCVECDGGDPDCDSCTDGVVFWGSWYESDSGHCDTCGAEDAPISEMCEDHLTCLPCWIELHRNECGCNRWEPAEEAAESCDCGLDLHRAIVGKAELDVCPRCDAEIAMEVIGE